MPIEQEYRGRFAPSPTGPLHLGSLVAALASYLDAKAHRGRWLVRIEDIDPPRELPGSASQIIQTLQAHGLVPDEPVLYQSSRIKAYQAYIATLRQQGHLSACSCSRHQLRHHPVYPGTCRNTATTDSETALRLRVDERSIILDDLIQGRQNWSISTCVGDFVIRRRDKLFAYQLAVTIDGAFQRITRVVRGCDLLDSTARQVYLQQLLGFPTPDYAHLPVLVNAQGHKLSKQTGATPVDDARPEQNLWNALCVLGQNPPNGIHLAGVVEILSWARDNWNLSHLPASSEITVH